MFKSEDELTFEFERLLKNLFYEENSITILKQLKGVVGIPDFVLVDTGPHSRIIVSVELKIKNWRRALAQAFKYRAFSHLSFVLMDADRSKPALNNLNKFFNYNIGFATLDNHGDFRVHSLPTAFPPFSISLHKKFRDKVGAEGCNIINNIQRSSLESKFSEYTERVVSLH
jgi:hypothetical protein